jgi:hypothetical protein
MTRILLGLALSGLLAATSTLAQQKSATPAQTITGQFVSVNQHILDMARDFPADKYGYRATPDVRSFGEVIVHVFSGNVYAAKVVHDASARWDELDAHAYRDKAAIVAALEKSIADATAAVKGTPADRFNKTVEPWLDVTEHSAEHYGQLVVYYRLNGLVPPASRPSKP